MLSNVATMHRHCEYEFHPDLRTPQLTSPAFVAFTTTQATRAAVRDSRERVLDLERECESQRRAHNALLARNEDQLARLEEIRLQRGEDAEVSGRQNAELATLKVRAGVRFSPSQCLVIKPPLPQCCAG